MQQFKQQRDQLRDQIETIKKEDVFLERGDEIAQLENRVETLNKNIRTKQKIVDEAAEKLEESRSSFNEEVSNLEGQFESLEVGQEVVFTDLRNKDNRSLRIVKSNQEPPTYKLSKGTARKSEETLIVGTMQEVIDFIKNNKEFTKVAK